MNEAIGAAALLGIGGTLHCAGMCGPLALAVGAKTPRLLAKYHLARMLSYALVGLGLGWFGRELGQISGGISQVILAGSLAALLLLAVAWPSFRLPTPGIITALTTKLQRWVMRLTPDYRSLGMGMATPLLPCGLLYAAYMLAVSAGSAGLGLMVMITFALSSAPAVFIGQRLYTTMAGRLGERGQTRLQQALTVGAALFLLHRGWLQWSALAANTAYACHP
jgi:uncharacterized protein